MEEALDTPQAVGTETPAPDTAPATDTAPTPQTPEPPKPVETDRSWAAVQRHETKLRAERDQLKRAQAEFEQSQTDSATQREQLKLLQGGLKEDPLKVLKDNGITFEDLAKRVLNEGSASPEELIRRNRETHSSELDSLRQEVASLKSQQAERENERMVRDYQGEIKKALASDEFELLRAYPDAEEMVFEVASRVAAERSEVLTAAEASRRIQGQVREKLTALATNKAVRSLLGLQDAEKEESPPPDNDEQSTKPPGGINTLTNSLAGTPAVEGSNFDGSSALSTYEMLRRAAQLVKD